MSVDQRNPGMIAESEKRLRFLDVYPMEFHTS